MDINYGSGFKLNPATVNDPNQEVKKAIDRYAGPLNQVSWGFLLLALCTTAVGCLNLYFARDFLKWPFVSGSGIWSGLMVTLSSIVGIMLSKSDFTKDMQCWKRLFGLYYGLTIANISIGIQHTTYSAMSVGQCATGTCTAQAQASVIISYAFSTAFGLAIAIEASIMTVLNVKLRKQVRRRTPLC